MPHFFAYSRSSGSLAMKIMLLQACESGRMSRLSSVLLRLRRILLAVLQYIFSVFQQQCIGRLGLPRSWQEVQQMIVTQIANDLSATTTMGIWQVEATLSVKAHIACWHRQIQEYKGHLLCADRQGRTFLLDRRACTYVMSSPGHLLQIDGCDAAKRFIDLLLARSRALLCM